MDNDLKKQRLDDLLVSRGLAETRSQAKGLILAGKVWLGSQRLDKAGKMYPSDLAVEIEQPPRFVSRGAEKLEGFLEAYPFSVVGAYILDIGASTGGFTDLLLQRGAAHATCVDSGRGQLHNKLCQDPRVANLERTNARKLQEVALPHAHYDLCVIDVSFISLRLILPPVWQRLRDGARLVALIKPQFEAGKAEVSRGRGVIRDPEIHERVVQEIRSFVAENLPEAQEFGFCRSPLLGPDGNVEFLIGYLKTVPPAEG